MVARVLRQATDGLEYHLVSPVRVANPVRQIVCLFRFVCLLGRETYGQEWFVRWAMRFYPGIDAFPSAGTMRTLRRGYSASLANRSNRWVDSTSYAFDVRPLERYSEACRTPSLAPACHSAACLEDKATFVVRFGNADGKRLLTLPRSHASTHYSHTGLVGLWDSRQCHRRSRSGVGITAIASYGLAQLVDSEVGIG